ncbi:MAG TPA: tetratricopeptide repeat protein [Chroococcidiopsis sp.]
MTETTTETPIEVLFDQGVERYQAGEAIETLIPTFKEVCDRSPKSSAAWTCLSWLYLLSDKPSQALKAAKKAIKLNPQDPQARVNLAIAMLETEQKGVREHIEIAGQIVTVAEELRDEVKRNFEEGLSRKPGWKSLERVKSWIFDS